MSDAANYDVVVLGAGAAGIAAARRLVERRLTVVVIEARERLGGRAVTTMTPAGPVDLGCEWLHSADRNPLMPLARSLGFSVDEGRPDWGRLRRVHADAAAQEDWHADRRPFMSASKRQRPSAGIDRPRRAREAADAGTPCSTRSAPGPMASSSIACRCMTTRAMPIAASTGASRGLRQPLRPARRRPAD